MDEKINYDDIPKAFLYCSYKQCPRHNKCLRYQAMLCIPAKCLLLHRQSMPYSRK